MMIDIIKKIQKHGVGDYWAYFQHNILKIRRDKFLYLVKNLDFDDVKEMMTDFDLSPKELTIEDFYKGDKDVFSGNKLEVIEKRLEDKSYKVWGIIENDILIYSTWISTEKMGLPVKKSRYKLNIDEGLLEDSYCHPFARGRGFHSKMNSFRLFQLYKLGKSRAIAIVLMGNEYALKVQKKSGFKEVGMFSIYRILGYSFITLKGVKK